jgi:hypothetical protein
VGVIGSRYASQTSTALGSGLMGVNLKRGLLRLWLIGAVLWLAVAAVVFRPDWPALTLWSLGPLGTLSRTEQEADLRSIDDQLRRLESSGVTRADAVIADLNAALSGKPIPEPVATLEKLQTKRDTVESRINATKLRAESWSEIAQFAFLAFCPPLVVLFLGVSIIWAVRGFVA